MKTVNIIRACSRVDGTFGVLLLDNLPVCTTLERRWQNNEKSVSCIPAGRYIARRVISPKFGVTFEITGVANRDKILLHAGNIDDDSHGCVLLGSEFGLWTDASCCVTGSKKAFEHFMKLMQNEEEFEINIIESYRRD